MKWFQKCGIFVSVMSPPARGRGLKLCVPARHKYGLTRRPLRGGVD